MKRAVWAVLPLLVWSACKGKEGDGKSGSERQDAEPREVLVAGASDLVYVMEELAPLFEKESGIAFKFTAGSSGKLAAQIKEGAPFDMFFSANVKFVDDVVAAGACDGATKRIYARGRVVMWSGPDSDPPPPKELAGLADARYTRIAIANPEHAPYGAAARQAMEKLGVWSAVESRIVYGSNIKETMQFAETGNADVAIIALALAIKAKGEHVMVPQELHDPIDQGLVVCKRGKNAEAARRLATFLTTPEMVKLMERYGFAVPAN